MLSRLSFNTLALGRFLAVLLAMLVFGGDSRAEAPPGRTQLVMFERADCPYCRAWHSAIGPIFPKTGESRRAPLRRVDLAEKRPDDLAGIDRIVYTPTFVLVFEGREIGRIVGYGGEESFWLLLGELLAKLPP